MIIKTITCHNVYNHGASLQEHALLTFLKTLGHEAETIRYKPPFLSGHFKLWSISNPTFDKNIILRIIYLTLKLPKRLYNLKRKKQFDIFSNQFINAGEKLYRSNEELKNDLPPADAYICGSDQIWNSFFENGKDPAFYLDFVPNDKKKISYAASFAIDNLEEDLKPFVKQQVSTIDHVSVRESSGKKILEELDITDVTHVLDPVFLLSSSYWSAFEEQRLIKEEYLFIYDFDSNLSIKNTALAFKKKYNVKIITVNENIKYADKNYFYYGPNAFISLVKNASFVISNSFHAVAFSFIFQKKFLVYNRGYKINTRMRDLLDSLNCGHLLIEGTYDVEKEIDIDYNLVNEKLESLKSTSANFLINALKEN